MCARVCLCVWVRVQVPAEGFLGIQRFRVHLAKQRTRVRSLVQEDPMCQGATRARALHAQRGPCWPQLEKACTGR